MDSHQKKPTDPQITVVLRAAVGAYLLYLSWGLRETAFSGENPLYLLPLAAFGAAGIALLYVSVRKLRAGEFLRTGETPTDEGGNTPQPQEESAMAAPGTEEGNYE